MDEIRIEQADHETNVSQLVSSKQDRCDKNKQVNVTNDDDQQDDNAQANKDAHLHVLPVHLSANTRGTLPELNCALLKVGYVNRKTKRISTGTSVNRNKTGRQGRIEERSQFCIFLFPWFVLQHVHSPVLCCRESSFSPRSLTESIYGHG